ncbi:hypothetical protein F4561_005847 [Lipingzhangella halophila]|uniref:Uncharacterized protein n=1 Tax=Lipingzhangella halophila TaxID=1783352 RepID=A0A7W7RMX9_9ACTN|nr:hypothetical protein [Lipingzhangella halophila]MBB4934953.1 hypothetical protein [Lipingzhangella halophila]
MFDAEEETVDGATTCRGSYADSTVVRREVLVLYPKEDQAAVHLLAYESE